MLAGKRDVLLSAAIWLAVVLAGVWIRLANLTDLPLFGDENHTLLASTGTYGEILSYFDTVGSHMALPFLQHLSQDLFGQGILAMRLPAIVPALLTLLLLWPLGRHLVGSPAALVATATLALSPVHVFYSRFARTYALSALLALLLVDALRRATGESPRARHWLLVGLWSALLPYVHLSSAGLIVSLAAASLWLVWRRDRTVRALVTPLVCFALAGAVCALMFLPARESLTDYLSKIKGQGFLEGIGLLDVPTVLAGGRVAGALLLVGVPLGATLMIVREHRSGVLASAAIAGPLIAMLAFKPNGMAYAYARYVHVALPVMLVVLGWLLVQLVRGFGAGTPGRDRAAVVLGVGLALALHWTGPRAPWRVSNGPYDNTYLALRRLPPFDEPYPGTPEFYRQLAEDDSVTRIIEAPPMASRSVLLYRNYYLQHGKDTVFGLLMPKLETLLNGPYERVFDRELDQADADYLVVHMNVATEAAAYWNWVYHHAWSEPEGDPNASYMIRHRIYLDPPGPINPEMVRPLNRRFGRPVYTDERIRVWKLR